MRQAGGAEHQCRGDQHHVGHRDLRERTGVLREAEVGLQPVELVEDLAEADLRQRHAGDLGGHGDGRDQVGHDQHGVLRDLGPGDALHAAEDGVEEDDRHADDHAGGRVHVEEAGEDQADAGHLARHVDERDDDRGEHGDEARGLVVAVTDEVRQRVLAELAQVRRQQQRQQHVAAGPPHEEDAAGVPVVGQADDAGQGDERRGAHPVRGDGGAVGRRRDAAAGDVEAGGVGHPAGVGDVDVDAEGDDREDQRPELDVTHEWCTSCSYSSTPYSASSLSIRHT